MGAHEPTSKTKGRTMTNEIHTSTTSSEINTDKSTTPFPEQQHQTIEGLYIRSTKDIISGWTRKPAIKNNITKKSDKNGTETTDIKHKKDKSIPLLSQQQQQQQPEYDLQQRREIISMAILAKSNTSRTKRNKKLLSNTIL